MACCEVEDLRSAIRDRRWNRLSKCVPRRSLGTRRLSEQESIRSPGVTSCGLRPPGQRVVRATKCGLMIGHKAGRSRRDRLAVDDLGATELGRFIEPFFVIVFVG